jgi:hypothetical protein
MTRIHNVLLRIFAVLLSVTAAWWFTDWWGDLPIEPPRPILLLADALRHIGVRDPQDFEMIVFLASVAVTAVLIYLGLHAFEQAIRRHFEVHWKRL